MRFAPLALDHRDFRVLRKTALIPINLRDERFDRMLTDDFEKLVDP